MLSRFMHAPCKPHMEVALRVLRYLKSSPGQGLFFPSHNDLSLRAFLIRIGLVVQYLIDPLQVIMFF